MATSSPSPAAPSTVQRRAPTDWSRLDAPSLSVASLAVHGADVVTGTATSGSPLSQLLVSHDHGDHILASASPDVGLGCRFDEPVADVIWALCVTGMQSALTRSSDGGVTFAPLSHDQQFVNSSGLAAASSTTAVVTGLGNSVGALYLTVDGSRTFQPTGPTLAPGSGEWSFAGFIDATHGAAIATTATDSRGTPKTTVLYRTVDGGQTWAPVMIKA